MKLSQLQKLAKKVQLEIKKEEIDYLLASFLELEKLLVKFRQLPMKERQFRPQQTKLTLKKLHQLAKNSYSTDIIKQETIRHNAIVSPKNFIIIHKRKN